MYGAWHLAGAWPQGLCTSVVLTAGSCHCDCVPSSHALRLGLPKRVRESESSGKRIQANTQILRPPPHPHPSDAAGLHPGICILTGGDTVAHGRRFEIDALDTPRETQHPSPRLQVSTLCRGGWQLWGTPRPSPGTPRKAALKAEARWSQVRGTFACWTVWKCCFEISSCSESLSVLNLLTRPTSSESWWGAVRIQTALG